MPVHLGSRTGPFGPPLCQWVADTNAQTVYQPKSKGAQKMSASSPVTMVKLGRGPPVYRGTSLHTCTSVIPYGLTAYVGHMYALHMQSKERQKTPYLHTYLPSLPTIVSDTVRCWEIFNRLSQAVSLTTESPSNRHCMNTFQYAVTNCAWSAVVWPPWVLWPHRQCHQIAASTFAEERRTSSNWSSLDAWETSASVAKD